MFYACKFNVQNVHIFFLLTYLFVEKIKKSEKIITFLFYKVLSEQFC
nr:MAG TPA: hypothetical protein [Caudoviricetes sp.]